ncbi:MAG: hypothetical protein AAGF95_01555 [Chloroflexota bacterium]
MTLVSRLVLGLGTTVAALGGAFLLLGVGMFAFGQGFIATANASDIPPASSTSIINQSEFLIGTGSIFLVPSAIVLAVGLVIGGAGFAMGRGKAK